MSEVRPFRAVRPADNEKAGMIAALPYDVYSRSEAAEKVKGRPLSFLNIDRPETFFGPEQDMYAPEVYRKAREEYEKRKAAGDYIHDSEECYYLYELTMDGRSQTGYVGVVAVSDYESGICRKHENTVAEKEKDRICHISTLDAQTGPVFLGFHGNAELERMIPEIKSRKPVYDFVTEEGVGQRVWRINAADETRYIEECFRNVENTYIADGHHRAASAVKVALNKRTDRGEHGIRDRKGMNPEQLPESEFFLAALFPESELKIMSYNRIVSDLAGMSPEEFLERVENESAFHITESGILKDPEVLCPGEKNRIGMYLNGKYHLLSVKPEYAARTASDPVNSLDAALLQNTLLAPVLGIVDPRTDKRIRFVGGIRGLRPLVAEADAMTKDGNYAVSFAMYPTSMKELFRVADAGLLMPPKSTWFEPKLRSGLFIHEI